MEEEKLAPCWYQWGVKAGDLNRGGDFTPEEETQTFHLRVAGGGGGVGPGSAGRSVVHAAPEASERQIAYVRYLCACFRNVFIQNV